MQVLSKKQVNLARSSNRPATASVYAFEQEEEDENEVRNFQKNKFATIFKLAQFDAEAVSEENDALLGLEQAEVI